MKRWNELTTKEKVNGVSSLIAFVAALVIVLVAFAGGERSLSKLIDQDEAIATCVKAFRNSDAHYAFSSADWQHKVDRIEDAWIIQLKGVIMDKSGMWTYNKARYEVPFKRTDEEKSCSEKNIRSFEILN